MNRLRKQLQEIGSTHFKFTYKAVSLDVDGTLYNLTLFKFFLVLLKVKDIRKWLLLEKIRSKLRISKAPCISINEYITNQMAKSLDIEKRQAKKIIIRFLKTDWPAILRIIGPYSGIIKLLDTLKKYRIPVVVNSDYPSMEKLKALKLGDYPWAGIIDATSYNALKPSAKVFEHCVKILAVKPKEILHVGDSYLLDTVGAKQIGIDAALVGLYKIPKFISYLPNYYFKNINSFCNTCIRSLREQKGTSCQI